MEEGLCARVLKIIPVLWERWLLWWGAVNREGVIPRSNTPRHPEECSDVGISLDCHGQSPRNDVAGILLYTRAMEGRDERWHGRACVCAGILLYTRVVEGGG